MSYVPVVAGRVFCYGYVLDTYPYICTIVLKKKIRVRVKILKLLVFFSEN